MRLGVAGKDLTGARYIISRRSQGIRMSTLCLLTAGVDVTF